MNNPLLLLRSTMWVRSTGGSHPVLLLLLLFSALFYFSPFLLFSFSLFSLPPVGGMVFRVLQFSKRSNSHDKTGFMDTHTHFSFILSL